MAGRIIVPQATPAFDSNGDPDSGATLYFYENGDTNTPKSAYPTYADANAATSGFTSLSANSAGRFTDAFGPDDARYTVVWKDSDDVQVQRFDDVQVQGETESTLYRDFDTNGRLKVSGSGGKVQIETGDAVGDNTGGDARLGGWAGTQGDTLSIDYAATSVTGSLAVTSGITSDGGKTVSHIRVSGGTVASASNNDIAIPDDSDQYELILTGFRAGTAGESICLRNGYGATPTYQTSGYRYQHLEVTGSTVTGYTDSSSAALPLTGKLDNGTWPAQLVVRIYRYAGSVDIQGHYYGNTGSAARTMMFGSGSNESNTTAITYIRLLPGAIGGFNNVATSSNAVYYTWTLYKIKGHVSGQTA